MHNNCHLWFGIDKFGPTFLTMPKGSKILSVVSKDDMTLRVYAHTVDYHGEANVQLGVELAKSDLNWDIYEFRVFRAPNLTPNLESWTFLDTVKVRQNKCINHVWYRNRRDLLTLVPTDYPKTLQTYNL